MDEQDVTPKCDKFRARHPEACSPDVAFASCECGRLFRRCGNHGGPDGANRSRGSHRGIEHPSQMAMGGRRNPFSGGAV